MTVRELGKILQNQNQDAEVHIAYPSGDRWGSIIADPIKKAEIKRIKDDDYYGFVLSEEKNDKQVLVLSRS